MSRRTYNEGRNYSAHIMRFRESVYSGHKPVTMLDTEKNEDVTFALNNGCRVLLLRLSDDMEANGNVSVPRSVLARQLGVAPARVTEWVRLAHRLGFLTTIRRGRPGVTAVYRGLVPSPVEVRLGVPSQRYQLGTPEPTNHLVRPGVPLEGPAWYALGTTQELVQTAVTGTGLTDSPPRRDGDRIGAPSDSDHRPPTAGGKAASTTKAQPRPGGAPVPVCRWHGHDTPCPPDCAGHPSTRTEQETA